MPGPTATTPYRWLKAATGLYDATSGGSAVSTNGATVKRWEDQSGNGNHRTDATGCTYATADNACVFNGSNQKLVGGGSESPTAVLLVVWSNDTSGYHECYGGKNSDPAYDLDAIYLSTSTSDAGGEAGASPLAVKRVTTSDPSSGGTVTDGVIYFVQQASAWTLLGFRVKTVSGTTWLELFVNGMRVGAKRLAGTPKGVAETAIGAGYYNQSVADFANCRIKEELTYGVDVGDAEWEAVMADVASRNGLTLWTASPGTVNYRFASFLGDDKTREILALFQSSDGVNWKAKNCYYYPPAGQYVRDVWALDRGGGNILFAHTSEDFPGGTSTSFAVALSTDGGTTAAHQADVDVSALSASHAWAPGGLVDGGTLRMYGTTGSAIFEVSTTDLTGASGWGSPVSLAGQISGASGSLIDADLLKSGGTYGLWYVLIGEAIGYATGSSPTTGYTQQKAPTLAADAFGWVAGTKAVSGNNSDTALEGVTGTYLTDGTTRRQVWDAYRTGAGTKLGLYYSDSTDFNAATGAGTWGTVAAMNFPHGLPARHGSFFATIPPSSTRLALLGVG